MLLLAQDGITRGGARDEARDELSKRIYHLTDPSPLQRFMSWVWEHVVKLFSNVVNITPGGVPSLVVVILVIVALVVAMRLGLGPTHLRDALTDRRRGARVRSAEEYRAEAESLAAKGDFKEAVRARFRAIIRELEERAVLDPRPGRTAGEIAREGSTAVPAIREDLHAVAGTFNRAWYSRMPATRADYDLVRDADGRIRATRLVAV